MSWKLNVLGFLFYIHVRTCYAITYTSDSHVQDTYSNALQDISQTEYDALDQNDLNSYSYTHQPTNNYNYLPPSQVSPSTLPPVRQSYNYGPPAPSYYGIPSNVKLELHSYPQQYELHPYQSLLTKLKAKLNIFTIGKLVLKLLIFKKIIKFIGIICLLLFLPKLKHLLKDISTSTSMESGEVDSRQFPAMEKDVLEQRVNEIFNFALKAFQKF